MSLKKIVSAVFHSYSSLNTLQKMSFYAVANGRKTGIFDSWVKCEEQVKGFAGAKFKKFSTKEEAQQFVETYNLPSKPCSSLNAKSDNTTSVKNSLQDYSGISTIGENSSYKNKHQQFYYAVAKGRHVGIYSSWVECKQQIEGFAYPKYKKFSSIQEAEEFIKDSLNSGSIKGKEASHSAQQATFTKNNNAGENLTTVSYNGYQFNEDSHGYVHCFTDGSCESNGRANARAGIGVWFGSNHPLNVGEPVDGPPTNNVAEIQAATKAIKVASTCGIKKLQINTDSQFMIKCITQWMPKWKKNGWQLSSGGEVKNKDQLVELNRAIEEGVDVKWNYVQAHVGIDGNEFADKLARAGAANYKAKSTGRFKPY